MEVWVKVRRILLCFGNFRDEIVAHSVNVTGKFYGHRSFLMERFQRTGEDGLGCPVGALLSAEFVLRYMDKEAAGLTKVIRI